MCERHVIAMLIYSKKNPDAVPDTASASGFPCTRSVRDAGARLGAALATAPVVLAAAALPRVSPSETEVSGEGESWAPVVVELSALSWSLSLSELSTTVDGVPPSSANVRTVPPGMHVLKTSSALKKYQSLFLTCGSFPLSPYKHFQLRDQIVRII